MCFDFDYEKQPNVKFILATFLRPKTKKKQTTTKRQFDGNLEQKQTTETNKRSKM